MRIYLSLCSLCLFCFLLVAPAIAQPEARTLTYTFGRFFDDCKDELDPEMPAGIVATPLTKSNVRCHAGSAHFSFDWAVTDTLNPEKYLTFSLYPETEGFLQFSPADVLHFVASDDAGEMDIAVQYSTDTTFLPLDLPLRFSDSTNFFAGRLDTLAYHFQQDVVADTMSFRIYAFNAADDSQILHLSSISLTFQLNIPVATEDSRQLAQHAVSLGAYPQPFQDGTTMTIDLPVSEHVLIDVYDILGRRVDRLVDRWMPQGRHEVFWSATHQPPGHYVARLITADKVVARVLTRMP